MSKQKKNSLLAGHSRAAHTTSAKDEITAMKYVMDKPILPVYPLDDKQPPKVYPDYVPWQEDDSMKDKLKNSGYLNKGYFESPSVSNEYYSARNLIQETLFSSTQNCSTILKELSQHFTKAYKTRNEVINKISYSSNAFKVPPRVTLTASKKEAWLKDLANQDVPLSAVSVKLPHGIRNKVLVDSMCNYVVPISRAIWFTKCSLYSELLLLRRKYQSKQSSIPQNGVVNFPPLDVFEGRWLQEWTQQVADYVFKFSKEMPNVGTGERKGPFQSKLNYLLSYISSLYVERLIDRVFFLSSIIKFLRDDLPFDTADLALLLDLSKAEEGEELAILSQLLKGRSVNYGQILVGMTLITMFWNDIMEEDFLCKYFSESLLLNHFLIEKIPVLTAKTSRSSLASSSLSKMLKDDLLLLISTSINKLFKHNTNVFIVPNYWVLIGDVLYQVLMKDNSLTDPIQQENLQKVLQLINYRNVSLMLNMKYLVREERNEVSPRVAARRSSYLDADYQSASSKSRYQRVEEAEHTYINRATDDNLKFVEQLDNLKLNNSLTALLKPRPSTSFDSNLWKTKLKIVVYWCVTVYRVMGSSSEKILIICNYLKRKVLQALTTRGSSHLKAEFENELLESIFSLSQEPAENICMYNLYVLINELYQLKIISISSYLRKIIACGVFYKSPQEGENITQLSNDPQISFHLSILRNLPVLNNKQCDHILRKWTVEGFDFLDHFTSGTSLLQEHFLNCLVNNTFGSKFHESLQTISSLNVGVKFLLVNWLTSQVKKTISNSPRLIHITPSTIANIYSFYSITDNLTVFFKVFVKYVLQNENKVIIFYLDTLYFISKLILHHHNLVKFIAGSSYEAVSSAYELFKLVILNYKDLSSRETDLYKFKEVWRIIDSSVEKSSKTESMQTHTTKGGLDRLLYGRETADSPVKISAHATRQNDAYSAETFKYDLESLLTLKIPDLSGEELDDCFNEIAHWGHPFKKEQFTDINLAEQAIQQVLHEWLQRVAKLTESEDLAIFKLLETLKKNFKLNGGTMFYSCAQLFVSEVLQKKQVNHELALLLAKLLTYEILSIFDLFNIFRQLHNSADWLTEIFTFGSNEVFGSLFSYQSLLLDNIQKEYIRKHYDDVVIYSLERLKKEGMHSEKGIFVRHKDSILGVVRDALIFNRKWTMHCLVGEMETKDSIELCDQLFPSELLVSNIDDISNLAKASNEFSLPIIQTILKVITTSILDPNKVQVMASTILDNLHFSFGPQNSYFGEMFNYLDWGFKLQIFNYLEKIFLTQIQFEPVWDLENAMVTEDVHYVSLRLNEDGIELIPIFKDCFKKFSVSSVDKLDTPPELFENLSNFLVKLLQLLNNQAAVESDDRTIHDTISILLRLLIIHKTSLTSAMAREDSVNFVFLKNLVALLNSSYLADGHEKLRILLYDLLLLMKSSLTQILSVASDDIMATSPQQNSSHSPSNAEAKRDNALSESSDYGSNALSTMSAILNLPEPSMALPFETSGSAESNSAIALDHSELENDGDIDFVNQSGLVLQHCRRDSMTFIPYMAQDDHPSVPFSIKSLKLIEDTSTGLNDGCIDLSLFDAYTTKENPL